MSAPRPIGVRRWLTLVLATVVASTAVVVMTAAPASAASAKWLSISAGDRHACGVRDDHTLWCWGANTFGQLGVGDTEARGVPTQVGSQANWASVAAGGFHTCGVKVDGGRFCWGANDSGQLGINDTTDRDAPRRLIAEDGIVWLSVSAGRDHSCGVRADHTLLCWGANTEGRLGVGDTSARDVPVRVGSQANWGSVSAGATHTCALKTDGTRYCWGANRHGQLGLGDTTDRTAPRRIVDEGPWISISTGSHYTCGIKSWRLYCWGYNYNGQLGDGTATARHLPVKLGNLGYQSVEAGTSATCGVTTLERRCWGLNAFGQLGIGHYLTPVRTPTALPGEYEWSTTSVGDGFSCGLNLTGYAYCWGSNSYGVLGNGSTHSGSSEPVRVLLA